VTARLDHVRDLGATVVWLTPIQPIGLEKRKGTCGSPYSIRDFHGVNPDYGTAEDVKTLVREAHARGLKVILDVVANHTSWDSVMMATLELYVRDAQGRVTGGAIIVHDISERTRADQQIRKLNAELLVRRSA
jgi:1,4-alpha-glucan branching enzyme